MKKELPLSAEKLLQDLQSADAFVRKTASEEIGKLSLSDALVLRTLKVVAESDSNKYVRDAARQSYLALGGKDLQQDTDIPISSDSVPNENALSKFNRNSWLVCTFGLVTLFMLFVLVNTTNSRITPYTSSELAFDLISVPIMIAIGGAYLSIPYRLYENQVVKGQKMGCFEIIVFFVMTGAIYAVVFVLLWDIIRHALKAMITPPSSENIYFMYIGKKNPSLKTSAKS